MHSMNFKLTNPRLASAEARAHLAQHRGELGGVLHALLRQRLLEEGVHLVEPMDDRNYFVQPVNSDLN